MKIIIIKRISGLPHKVGGRFTITRTHARAHTHTRARTHTHTRARTHTQNGEGGGGENRKKLTQKVDLGGTRMTKEKTQEIVGIRWMGPNQCDMPLVGGGGVGGRPLERHARRTPRALPDHREHCCRISSLTRE